MKTISINRLMWLIDLKKKGNKQVIVCVYIASKTQGKIKS